MAYPWRRREESGRRTRVFATFKTATGPNQPPKKVVALSVAGAPSAGSRFQRLRPGWVPWVAILPPDFRDPNRRPFPNIPGGPGRIAERELERGWTSVILRRDGRGRGRSEKSGGGGSWAGSAPLTPEFNGRHGGGRGKRLGRWCRQTTPPSARTQPCYPARKECGNFHKHENLI